MPLQDIGTDVRTPAALAEHSGVRSGFLQRLLPKLLPNRPWNLITAPVIYSMIVPLLILDLFVSVYQATCFPIYGIARVCRGDYIIFDRQHLAYLDAVDKVHCSYCAYGTKTWKSRARSMRPEDFTLFQPPFSIEVALAMA